MAKWPYSYLPSLSFTFTYHVLWPRSEFQKGAGVPDLNQRKSVKRVRGGIYTGNLTQQTWTQNVKGEKLNKKQKHNKGGH